MKALFESIQNTVVILGEHSIHRCDNGAKPLVMTQRTKNHLLRQQRVQTTHRQCTRKQRVSRGNRAETEEPSILCKKNVETVETKNLSNAKREKSEGIHAEDSARRFGFGLAGKRPEIDPIFAHCTGMILITRDVGSPREWKDLRGFDKRVGDLWNLAGVVLTESVYCSGVIEEEHVIGSTCDLDHRSWKL